jgi:hypothetical protein
LQTEKAIMRRRVVALMLGAALITATLAPPTAAQYLRAAPSQPERKLTPQQERLKRCGAKWQEMKRQGKTEGIRWADFRRDCMRRKDG